MARLRPGVASDYLKAVNMDRPLPAAPPPLSATIALAFLRLYQHLLSPLLWAISGSGCRFYPSCSEYAAQAVRRYGVGRGTYLAARRLCRCHPLHPGGYDPLT